MSRNKREGRYFGYMCKKHMRTRGNFMLKTRTKRTFEFFEELAELEKWL